MTSQASHAVFYEANFPHIAFPKASFTPFPSDLIYHDKRRGRPILNRHLQNKLYLTAAHLPTEERREVSGIKQATNDPTLNQPMYQIMKNLDSMEASVNKKVEDLQDMGVEGYINKKLVETKSHGEDNVVDTPDNSEALAGSVVATNEMKVPKKTPRPAFKNLLPIKDHVAHSKPKRRRKS